MSSLNSVLSIALSGLQASQGALDVTSNNISNSDTPGYSREVVNLSESAPITDGSSELGTGVTLQGFTSVRDEVLQMQIDQQTQQSNYSLAQSNALQQAQTPFSDTTDNISTNMTSFFNDLSSMSTDPSNTSQRQSVLNDATNVASSFQSAASTLSSLQTTLDESVPPSVNEINQITTQIADLNAQIESAHISGQNPSTLEDETDQLVSQLSELTNLQTTNTSNGLTVTTGSGTPLVVGNQAYALSTATGSNGLQEVLSSDGQDITSSITGGSLGGTLQVRDTAIPGYLSQLNTLATQFSSAVNTANEAGYDLTGAAGQAIFSTSATSGAASSIQVAITSGSQIAASSDGTTGSAGNLSNLLAVQTAKLPSGTTPTGAYSQIVSSVGEAASAASANSTAASASLTQLQSQMSSITGVSLDEETTNMIRYQMAYQAAAKVISTVETLSNTLIGITTT
jgi:flagellar hook-associated protein 1 FlgK